MLWLLFTLALATPPADLVDALAARHATGDCPTLLATHGVEALVEVANGEALPPWLPMRAASCVGQDPSGDEAVLGWLGDPETPGLAVAAVDGLALRETVPERLIQALRTRLADERFAKVARLERSPHPQLRALSR